MSGLTRLPGMPGFVPSSSITVPSTQPQKVHPNVEASTIVGGHKMAVHPRGIGEIDSALKAISNANSQINEAHAAIKSANVSKKKALGSGGISKNDTRILNKLIRNATDLSEKAGQIGKTMTEKYSKMLKAKNEVAGLVKKYGVGENFNRKTGRDEIDTALSKLNTLSGQYTELTKQSREITASAGKIASQAKTILKRSIAEDDKYGTISFLKGYLNSSNNLINSIGKKLDGGYLKKDLDKAGISSSEIGKLYNLKFELEGLTKGVKNASSKPEDATVARIKEINTQLIEFSSKLEVLEESGVLKPLSTFEKVFTDREERTKFEDERIG